MHSSSALSILVPGAIIAWAFYRSVSYRRIARRRLVIGPLVMVAVLVIFLPKVSGGNLNIVVALLAAVLGGAVGWAQGHFVRLEIDPRQMDVIVGPTFLTAVIMATLIVIRIAFAFMTGALADPDLARAAPLAGVPLAFTAGVIIACRFELLRRSGFARSS